jgi:HSP20 family protein
MSVTLTNEPPPFGNLARQMGKFVEQFQKGYYNFMPGENWTPNVNLYETENVYLVCVDLAGVDKDKIDLTVVDQRLKIKGTREVPTNPDANEGDLQNRRIRVHLMEIDHGGFSREVELPRDVEHDKIIATHKNGLLWIELPKK